MAVIEIAKIQVRRGQENITGVPQLDPGEFGWAQDTQHLYIGKRISEGANNDDNARVLTDLDLRDILDMIGGGQSGSTASTSTYRYRDDLDYTYFRSTTTTVARKLDSQVNLADFSQTTLNGDITQVLKRAITDIYANDYYGTDTIRTLKLPAGDFVVSGVVDLPPSVTLVGEGAGITRLILDSAGTSMFRTVDKLGAHFEQSMQFDGRASKNVEISNMTIAYSGDYSNNAPLISLDNTERPKIRNVEFTTINTTTGYVSSGVGIEVRGSIGDDESTVICKDIEIVDCRFNVLNIAIKETGAVSKSIIEGNSFSNLNNGIYVSNTDYFVPSDLLVSKNKFSFVFDEAIYTTTATNATRIVSSENQYYYVGNRSSTPDQISYASKPVLTFNTPGNISLNDHFNRVDVPFTTDFYYNPLVNANAKVINDRPREYILPASTNDQKILKIPLTGQEQLVVIEYLLSNSDMSRKGKLTLNIAADGYASVSDYYNYSELTTGESARIIFSTDYTSGSSKNYVWLTASNFSSYQTNLQYTLEITV